jgi:fluoride exporter
LIYFLVGLGGIIGSLIRYVLSVIAVMILGKEFPFGTLFINLTGALLLGFITNRFVSFSKMHTYLYSAFTTGVIGSYTTFSTFCLETVHLLETGKYFFGVIYLVVSLFGGLFFVRVGIKLSEQGKIRGELYE